MTPLGRGFPSTHQGRKNWGIIFGDENVFFAAPKAPRKIFEHFFEIFGKFVNKNAIKSDFWGVVCRYISKISKKSSILGKKYFYTRRKISKVFLQRWGHPPPKKIPLIQIRIEILFKVLILDTDTDQNDIYI